MKRIPAQPPESLSHDLRIAGYLNDSDHFTALHGGRTNQVWQISGNGQNRVLKLYRSDRANPMFCNDPQSEVKSLNRLADTGLAPKLLGFGAHKTGHWVIYSHIYGQAWKRAPAPVARLLASVHQESPPDNLPTGPNGSSEIEHQVQNIMRQSSQSDRKTIAELKPVESVPPANKLCFIHRDPVPGNIVVTPQRIVLIDWQCPAIGDPAEDLALFMSPAMQLLYRNSPLTKDEEQSFLAAYPQLEIVGRYHLLKHWYHWRMAAYCLRRMGQGDAEYAEGFRLECAHLGTGTFTNHPIP